MLKKIPPSDSTVEVKLRITTLIVIVPSSQALS